MSPRGGSALVRPFRISWGSRRQALHCRPAGAEFRLIGFSAHQITFLTLNARLRTTLESGGRLPFEFAARNGPGLHGRDHGRVRPRVRDAPWETIREGRSLTPSRNISEVAMVTEPAKCSD